MNILYVNVLETATTIAPSSQNSHFNVGNMLVSSLRIPYRSVVTNPNIVIDFATAKTFDCIGLAGHNLATLRCRLLDASDAVLHDETFTDLLSTDILYLTSTSGVYKVWLNMTTLADYVEIGYMSMGEFYHMPRPTFEYDESLEITNEVEQTKFGQSYGTDGVVLQTYSPDFTNITRIQLAEIQTIVRTVRNYKPIFVDMTEDAHDFKPPLYATLNMTTASMSSYSHGVQRCVASLVIRETL